MTLSNRKSLLRVALPAGLALVAFLATVPAGAKEAERTTNGCSQEVRRIPVATQGGNPKLTPMPRYESRQVTVCEGKVVSVQVPRS